MSALVRGFDRYFFGAVDPLRPLFLRRALLALLAFDCWLDLVPHGARYGAGGFNVAHFAVLDTLLPMPTPALYVGGLLVAGWLALTMALAGPTRAGMAALTTLYTLGWSISMLDSYQHHYLLSLLLLAMTFFPETSVDSALHADLHDDLHDDQAEQAEREAAPRESWAYALFCASCAIVYFYTAITKTNADWRDGSALSRLAGNTDAARAMVALAADYGLSPAEFWSVFAKSAIALQLLIALGFVLAPVIDRLPRVRVRRSFAFWVLAPLSFHVGAAHMKLEIGWFTEYMLLVAVIVFLPRELLAGLLYALSAPIRAIATWLDAEVPARGTAVGIALVSALGVAGVLSLSDLPGDRGAGIVGGALLAALALAPLLRGELRRALPTSLAGLVSAGLLLLALVESDVRFDYYRNAGGDARRRASETAPELFEEAVQHYTRAQRYYPAAYAEFWAEWDREAVARATRGEPPRDEARAQAEGAPPRDRARQLADMQARVAELRARGLLPAE